MSETKPGFVEQIKSFPRAFWVANTMEIFERLSWYGWFTVMALYVTAPPETGGLGFSTETRGNLMGIVPFFLYLMPVLTGALADRYGYKKMFIIAYVVMVVAYYCLGQFTSLPGFFMAFMFVAVGAAVFKPVVVGTVAKVTNEGNSSLGFGVFYMMVNVGGFLGPIVAGYVRGWSWDYVFIACSGWAAINLLIVLFLYKEPEGGEEAKKRSFRQVLDGAVEVLGNLRFFVTVFVVLIALMIASLEPSWFPWTAALIFIPVWLIANFVYDQILPKGSGHPDAPQRMPLAKRMYCGNWRFALFLFIMSGFWTSFNQIFITMPEYIRDFTETKPLISAFQSVFGEDIDSVVATISDDERTNIQVSVQELVDADASGALSEEVLEEGTLSLLASKVRLRPDRVRELVEEGEGDGAAITDQAIEEGRQFNPEFIVNINAGAIIIFQILVSFLVGRFHRFTTMIAGMMVAGIGIGLSAFAGAEGMLGAGGTIWIVCLGLLTFSFGEMMASPTSQEYVGRIAPRDKIALYMGYYFVAIALGNLFGGILSGQLYGKLARDLQRPELMWGIFGILMFFTAFIFFLYDRFAMPRGQSDKMNPESGG